MTARHGACGQAMYEKLQVEFLLDDSDTIAAYEERGKQKTAAAVASHQRGIDAFTSSLGRVQQIELLQGDSDVVPGLYILRTLYHSLYGLQCFDTVGWAAGRASGLQKN